MIERHMVRQAVGFPRCSIARELEDSTLTHEVRRRVVLV
jgi:hypothetical protein